MNTDLCEIGHVATPIISSSQIRSKGAPTVGTGFPAGDEIGEQERHVEMVFRELPLLQRAKPLASM
jgi:hypothetical protein